MLFPPPSLQPSLSSPKNRKPNPPQKNVLLFPQGLAQNPAWAESSSAPPSPLSLAYPLAAVTMVGEYLMGLPQQLDVLMLQAAEEAEAAGATTAAEDAALDDELSAMAASWLDRVAHTAAEMYLGTHLLIASIGLYVVSFCCLPY